MKKILFFLLVLSLINFNQIIHAKNFKDTFVETTTDLGEFSLDTIFQAWDVTKRIAISPESNEQTLKIELAILSSLGLILEINSRQLNMKSKKVVDQIGRLIAEKMILINSVAEFTDDTSKQYTVIGKQMTKDKIITRITTINREIQEATQKIRRILGHKTLAQRLIKIQTRVTNPLIQTSEGNWILTKTASRDLAQKVRGAFLQRRLFIKAAKKIGFAATVVLYADIVTRIYNITIGNEESNGLYLVGNEIEEQIYFLSSKMGGMDRFTDFSAILGYSNL